MKKTALLLFMLFAFVAKAQETVLLGEAPKDGFKYYIYSKTIKKSERLGYITAWFLFEYSEPEYLSNWKSYTSSKEQMIIDCKNSKLGKIKENYYSKRGNLVHSTESKNEYLVNLSSVSPGSVGERIVEMTCSAYDLAIAISNQNQE